MIDRLRARSPWTTLLVLGGLLVLAALVWQGVSAHGNPDPSSRHLDRGAVVLDTAVLVLREGLEAILVLAALTASFAGANAWYRRPVALGVGVGLLASVATWFVVVAVLSAISAPALELQAATGLLAILVLLVVMNWFFHRVYWTGWISHHNRRRRALLSLGGDARRRLLVGLTLLGFTALYREGFEIVLFLQTLRMQAGSSAVLEGVSIGLFFTGIVGALTFSAHHRLPYKRMLVWTGIMLGFVLMVMVGESVQEMQQAGWLPVTPIGLSIPAWAGVWFALFPNVQGLLAQGLSGAVVIGSYVVARDLKVRRPLRRGTPPAIRAATPPEMESTFG
jgi:high-affinity iron transporter